MAVTGLASVSVIRASCDTRPRTNSDPNLNPFLKNDNPRKIHLPTQTTLTISTTIKKGLISTSELLKLNPTTPISQKGNIDELHLGVERWLPVAPKVKKPRSIYNAASLAYLGDCIYELYARRHFLFPPLNIEEYNYRVMAVVRCEAQDALLKKLIAEDYLTEEERDILRWGRNILGKQKPQSVPV